MTVGGDNDDIEWSAFLAEGNDPGLFWQERVYLVSIREFAAMNRAPVVILLGLRLARMPETVASKPH
ncbi:MAG: hypothetical protein FWE35_26685 [Streptosporangiales bacterium]|jgi:hypothetical protein|nr:hypothetical protein [Streptosporangiales bacterium]